MHLSDAEALGAAGAELSHGDADGSGVAELGLTASGTDVAGAAGLLADADVIWYCATKPVPWTDASLTKRTRSVPDEGVVHSGGGMLWPLTAGSGGGDVVLEPS
jgi:hypothetical protein